MKYFILFVLIITCSYEIKINTPQATQLNAEATQQTNNGNQTPGTYKYITPEYAEPKIKAHVEVIGPALIKKNEDVGTIDDPLQGESKLVLHTEGIGTLKREQDVMVSLTDSKVIPEPDDNLEDKKYFGI